MKKLKAHTLYIAQAHYPEVKDLREERLTQEEH